MPSMIIVDDDPLILVGLKSMLDWPSLGVDIAGLARNGRHALEMIGRLDPDLVFCDIKMPVMDGLELLEACRKTGWNGQFIVLTSYDDFSLAQKALRLGADDYLVKIEISEKALSSCVLRALAKVKGSDRRGKPPLNEDSTLLLELLAGKGDGNTTAEAGLPDGPWCVIVFRSDVPDPRNAMDMAGEILGRSMPSRMVKLEGPLFAAVVRAGAAEAGKAAGNAVSAVATYFNAPLLAGIGRTALQPAGIGESHHDALLALKQAAGDCPVAFADHGCDSPHRKLVDAVKAYVYGHIMERLTLPGIAEHFGMSPNYLSTVFKQETGEGLSRYMTAAKIGKAMELMQQRRMKVREVAEILGYDNSDYFSKVFHKVTGRPPKEWSQGV